MSLFIGRLTHNVRSDDLRYLFEPFGPLERCEVKTTYGFVTFKAEEDAERAKTELQDAELKGARINVEWTKSSGRGPPRRSRRHRYDPYRRSISPRDRSWSRGRRYSRSRSRSRSPYYSRRRRRSYSRSYTPPKYRRSRSRSPVAYHRRRSRSPIRSPPPRSLSRDRRSYSPYSRSPTPLSRSRSASHERSPVRSPPRNGSMSRSRSPVRDQSRSRSRSRSPVRE